MYEQYLTGLGISFSWGTLCMSNILQDLEYLFLGVHYV